MLVEDINTSVRKAPKKKETGHQNERDHKSLINKILLVTVYRRATIHIQFGLVITRLSGFATFPIPLFFFKNNNSRPEQIISKFGNKNKSVTPNETKTHF